MRVNIASIRIAAVNLCLLLVACVVGLVLCEVSLRLFYPKYLHVAKAQFRSDAIRLWARSRNSRDWGERPDTLTIHSLHHNNLALRQHRNFRATDLAAATNIGVFGDSFTENSRMAAQYSFTEPLDYLLNQGRQRFNVLNFGVDGYGTGQSLLHYEYFPYAEDLDHVLYIYCYNDLEELYETKLFHLNETGRLVRNEAIRESWWAPLVRKSHIAYLVLDVSGRWSSVIAENERNIADLRRSKDERRATVRQGRPDDASMKNRLAIFRQLIRRWKRLVEHNGRTFSVVLLPTHIQAPFVVDLLKAEDVETIDLNACFGTHDPAHKERPWIESPYRFKDDVHWNEAGNRLAAVCLYRVLEEKTGLPRLSEGRLQEILSRYYAAFERDSSEGRGGGAGALQTLAKIRRKYLAFDMNLMKDEKEEILELGGQPKKRIISSAFDVYLDPTMLTYVKEICSPADMAARFFLHVIPVDKSDLPVHRRRRGFERIEFGFAEQGFRGLGGPGCIFRKRLPRLPIRYLRTGQYVPDEDRLWEGEAWIDPHSAGETKPEFPPAPGTRIIQSTFDVYLDDRQLVYHKAVCGPDDRENPFFLEVTPTDATVLSRDRKHQRFDDLDFNNTCTTERKVPAYAIRHIRTGQYVPSKGELWKVEFSLDPARSSRGDESSAAPQRIARSVFDVTLDGRRLIYRKAECRLADLEAQFFLHVVPVDETDLSSTRFHYGFDSLDFSHPSKFSVNEFGCTKMAWLPSYALRRIRTGQYMPGKGPLWEGEFAMTQDALEQD